MINGTDSTSECKETCEPTEFLKADLQMGGSQDLHVILLEQIRFLMPVAHPISIFDCILFTNMACT